MASKVFGIDLGTRSIKICKKDGGLVLNQKNVVAIEKKTKVIAIGDEAFEMYGKAPATISVIFPVKNGVIADIANMQALLNKTFKDLNTGKFGSGSEFVVAVPTDITEVEKKAFHDLVATSTKTKKISIVEKPIADAVGAGLDVTNAKGVMVVDIGADTTEISIMSLGGIVISKLIRVGGNKFDESIKLYVKKKYNLFIGDKTAEDIKKSLASAYDGMEQTITVYGRNIVTGLPIEMNISANMVFEAIKEYLYNIIDAIKVILERTPPEISADIIDAGIYVTGGSANIRDIDKLISEETGLKINICSNASTTVIEGLEKIIETPEFKDLAKVPSVSRSR